MPDLPDDKQLRERLEADEPGAPPGYLLDRDDTRTPCAIGLDDESERDDRDDRGASEERG